MIALRIRRREPSFRDKRLAVGLFGSSADRWARRNRLPRAWITKLGHLLAGMILGATLAAIILAYLGCAL